MDAEAEKITDLRFLSKFTGGDKVKMERYIHMFLSFASTQIEKMDEYTAEKNWGALSISMGLLKAQMLYMGIRNNESLVVIAEMINLKKPSSVEIKEELYVLRKNLNMAIGELEKGIPEDIFINSESNSIA